jgi:protein Mpv17
LRRVAAFASFGAIYTGWFQMHWFRILQGMFPAPSAAALAVSGRRLSFFRKDVLGPLLVNQFAAVPCLYYPFYFGWTGFVRGATLDESLAAARAKYKPHLLAQNWAFWLPAQGVQFALVPSGYHILYVSAMGLAWNTILSLTTLDPAGGGKRGGDEEEMTKKQARGKMVVARRP